MAVQSENERNKAMVDEYIKAGVQGHLTSFAAYLRLPPAVSAQASYRSETAPQASRQAFLDALHTCPGMSEKDRIAWIEATNQTLSEG